MGRASSTQALQLLAAARLSTCNLLRNSAKGLPYASTLPNLVLSGLQPFASTTSHQDANGNPRLGVAPFRTFASQAPSAPNVLATRSAMEQVPTWKLRQELDLEAERNLHIPYSHFEKLAISSGAALDSTEAEKVCDTLEKAGIILRYSNLVYLRAEEISEMVMLMLPGGREDAESKLKKVTEELCELDRVNGELEQSTHRMTMLVLSGGFFILVVHFASFIYLTWWELSWDVMEPIAYMISLFYTLVGYSYFLLTRGGVFDLQPFKEDWSKRFRERKILELGFDEDRYNHLLKLKDRYERHLAHRRIRA